MATIKEYHGKKGPSYIIIVSCGYDINGKQVTQQETWKPEPGLSKAQIKKALQKEVERFEKL